jgi:vitamin B12 transporter
MWRFISFFLISLAFTVSILPIDAHAGPSAAPSQVSAAPGAAASAPQEKYESPPGHAKTQPANGHKIAKKRDQKLPRMMIVVTATRMKTPLGEVGTATSVVTDTKIQAQQMHDVTNALREVPGVIVTQDGAPGTLAEVSIRGATPAQTLVMIDGVPLNDSTDGSFDLSNLMTDDLDRIEVVRGAGGSLYGSQAIGGVINMITKEGSGAPKFSLTSEGGNAGTQRQVATADGADGKLAYSGAISYFSTNGFLQRNDGSDNLSGAGRLDYHLDPDTTIRAFARYTAANVGLATYSIYAGIPINPVAHQRTEFMLYKGEIDRRFGEKLTASLSGYFVRDMLRINAPPFSGLDIFEADHIAQETRGAIAQAIYHWSRDFRSLAGFELRDRWAHSQSDYFFYKPPPTTQSLTMFNAHRDDFSGYIEQEAHFFRNHLIATGGFRVDGNTQFGNEVSPSWAVAMPFPDQGLTFRGSYSEGFRAPDFDSLYFPGYGNPNLAPEISSEWDGGVTKDLGAGVEITANYFSRRVHNLIVAVPCAYNAATCPDGAHAGNAGRVDTQGIEFIPSAHPVKGLSLSGSFTYLDETHVSSAADVQPTRVPKYSAQALAEYTRANLLRSEDSGTITVAYTFVGDRNDITPQGGFANNSAYHRVDLAASYTPGVAWGFVRGATLFTRINNLLDRHYQDALGFPAPTINYVAGMTFDF